MIEQNHTSNIIKVELKTELPYYLVGLPLLFLFGAVTRPGFLYNWPFALILTLAIVIYISLLYRLTTIEINVNRKSVALMKTNLLQMHKKQTYPLGSLQFTYKVEKNSLRSRLMNVCRLFVNGREVAAVIPDREGWTDENLNNLAKALNKAGVNKKFTGHSLKNAAIDDL